MATTSTMRTLVAVSALFCFGLGSAPLMAADAWQRIEHPTLDMLFTSPAVDFSGYEQVYLEPVSVWYPTQSTTAADRVDTLRDWAARELGSAIAANGLEIADAPGPNTMIVRVQFIDFSDTPVSAQALAWKRRFTFNVEPGHVTMVAELVDASTGDTVVRMADMQDEPNELPDDLQSALTGWSTVVATAVVAPTSKAQLASR
ncbi:MAG: DUF3313 family protein [Pseudomonadota bacterium]